MQNPLTLILCSNQFWNIDITLDMILRESILQELVIGDEFVVGPSFPVDSGHWNASWEDVIRDLTSDGTRCGLLNLGQIQIQQFIEKCEELLSSDKVSFVHHSDGIVCSSRHFRYSLKVIVVWYFWVLERCGKSGADALTSRLSFGCCVVDVQKPRCISLPFVTDHLFVFGRKKVKKFKFWSRAG